MAYVTSAQLALRFAGLPWWSDANQDGSLDADVVAEAIELASGEIDASAGQQYVVPLTLDNSATARTVRKHAGTLAAWILAGRVVDRSAREALKDDYDAAQKWMDRLRGGLEKLPDETATSQAAVGGRPVIAGDAGLVTRESMDGL